MTFPQQVAWHLSIHHYLAGTDIERKNLEGANLAKRMLDYLQNESSISSVV